MISEDLTPVTCAALSPDQKTIITGEVDGSVKIWTVSDLQVVETLASHDGPVTGVGFMAGENRVYSTGLDGIARFKDRATSRSFQLPKMREITASDVSGDGSIAVVGESEREDMEGRWTGLWRNAGAIVGGRSGAVSAWNIAPAWSDSSEPQLEAPIWSIDLEASTFEMATSDQCPTFIKILTDKRVVAFSRIMGGTNPGGVDLVSLDDGSLAHPGYWGSPFMAPIAATFDTSGERMIVVTWQGLILQIRRLDHRQCEAVLLEEQPEDLEPGQYESPWWAPSAVSGSPDGRLILLGSRMGDIRLYDVPGRKRIAELVGHTDEVTAAQLLLGSKYVFSAGLDSSLRVWKLPDFTLD